MAERAWALFQAIEQRGGMTQAATEGWIAGEIRAVETTREKTPASRIVTGVSEHPDVREDRLARSKPDRKRLRIGASTRLVAWRRDHRCAAELGGLVYAAEGLEWTPGSWTGAAVRAAEAGATLGQLTAALVSERDEAQAAHIGPMAIRSPGASEQTCSWRSPS